MEKDFINSAFFSDNERYADIINGIGCNGIPFVKGEDLQEVDTKVLFGGYRRFGRKRKKRTVKCRDLMRRTAFGMNFAMIGIENQEEIDYALGGRMGWSQRSLWSTRFFRYSKGFKRKDIQLSDSYHRGSETEGYKHVSDGCKTGI